MTTPSLELSRRLELARQAAVEAGRLTLDYFQQTNYQVEWKSDNSPVTVADKRAEQLLCERIAAAFPGDGILGEEFGERPGDSPFRWILDPIDGTKAFVCGVPLYGTLVGVTLSGESSLGVIYMPALDELVYAGRGLGAWHSKGGAAAKPARVSTRTRLTEGLFLTSEVGNFAKRGAEETYQQLERAAYLTRTWGDCYGYLLVATGRAELMVDPLMNVWDAAAIQPILEEAGGAFTDWQGRPTIHSGEGLGACAGILAEALAITRQAKKSGAKI